MRLDPRHLTPVAILIAALVATPAVAQDRVVRAYSFTPKDGMAAQFEAALKAHLQWRVDNGDPWTWGANSLEVGDGLGEYSVRSGNHTWADMDAYDAGFGPRGLQHFQATVSPLLESVSSTITTVDDATSHRPPTGHPVTLVTITRFHIRPDRQQQANEAIATASRALMDRDWPGYWIWEMPISGGGMGPYIDVVALHENWADMQEPDPPMMTVLAEALGQSRFQEWLTGFGESIRGQETIVRRLRPDLNGSR